MKEIQRSTKTFSFIFFPVRYRISSYKTRWYYVFVGPSTAGIIRTRVLFEGVDYSKKLPFLEIKVRLNVVYI